MTKTLPERFDEILERDRNRVPKKRIPDLPMDDDEDEQAWLNQFDDDQLFTGASHDSTD